MITSQSTFDVDAVRGDFPIFGKPLPNGKQLVYLDSASSAQKPLAVIRKEAEVYENYYANAYRGVYDFGARVDDELEATRDTVREMIGAESPREIVFTSGTTMSINLVANAWGRKFLNPDDEIVVNEMEHHGNLVPWQQIAAEKDAHLRYIPLTDDGRLDLSQLDQIISNKTRMIAVTGMSNVMGTINPIDKIVARAKQVGALVLVDGAQSVPHLPINVSELGIDFLAFSGHKLYGPTGIGILYGRRALLDEMDPFLCGGHMIDRVYRDHSTWAEPPAKFEAGTIPIVPGIALRSAIEYLDQLGFAAIHAHEQTLLRYAHERLLQVPGLTIYGPDVDAKGAIIAFNIDGVHPQDLATLLDFEGVYVRHGHHCTMPLHDLLGIPASVRASFGVYNRESDVDALVAGIEAAKKKLRM